MTLEYIENVARSHPEACATLLKSLNFDVQPVGFIAKVFGFLENALEAPDGLALNPLGAVDKGSHPHDTPRHRKMLII